MKIDPDLLFMIGGPVLVGTWLWTIWRVALMRRGGLKWVFVAMCILPTFSFSDGQTSFTIPVLYPFVLIATFFVVERRRQTAKTAVERASGG